MKMEKKSKCDNFRLTALLDIVNKIVALTITKRVEEVEPIYQEIIGEDLEKGDRLWTRNIQLSKSQITAFNEMKCIVYWDYEPYLQ